MGGSDRIWYIRVYPLWAGWSQADQVTVKKMPEIQYELYRMYPSDI